MQLPAGYRLRKRLLHGPDTEVYAAVRERDGREVVLKAYVDRLGLRALESAQRERDVLQSLAGRGIPAVLELVADEVAPALVLEAISGASLSDWSRAEQRPVDDGLEVAIQLAALLERVHHARLVHGDVTALNVLVNPTSLETWLIDFGLARPVGAGASHPGVIRSRTHLMSELRFIAPEQSGRMGRGVDARSDLYSLGAVLYLVFTGSPVFDLDDRLALIHAHMARVPRPPVELRPELPEALSRIVLRLLAKEPDERYPTAAALRVDLELCRAELASGRELDADFRPGARAVADHPVFAAEVLGREAEAARLQRAWTEAAAGELRVLVLYGEPGIGKSRLVDRLRPHVALADGYIAAGKFDAYSRHALSAVTQALRSLVEQFLTESDTRLRAVEQTLRAEMGKLLPTAVALLPELRFIVGEASAPAPLGAAEMQARSAMAIQRLLRGLARPARPLVVFLDDVQWIDPESQRLLIDVVPQCLDAAMLLICAFRSDPESTRVRVAWTQALESRGAQVEKLPIRELDLDAVTEMLARALDRECDAETAELAAHVRQRTGGNPLHIRQYIEYLHAQGLLRIPRAASAWSWSLDELVSASVPDDVVAFMARQIGMLAPGARTVIERAALIGDAFDAEALEALGAWSRGELEQCLFELVEAGLIRPSTAGFRFTHDRIREAAQAGLSEEVRADLHYEMARYLIQSLPEAERGERADEIVEHLNRAVNRVRGELRLEAMRLNQIAAKRCLAAGAAASADARLRVGIDLIREPDWEIDRALVFALQLDGAESALQCARFDRALELLDELERRAPSLLELTQIAVKRIQVYGVTRAPEDTVGFILDVLRRLGVRWPSHPPRWRAQLALWLLRWSFRRRIGADMLQPATQIDLEWLAPILVIGQSGAAFIRHDTYLTVLATCKVLRTYRRHGYAGRAAFSIASYAIWTQAVLGDPRTARELARASLEFNARAPDPLYGPRGEFQVHATLNPWLMRRSEALAPVDAVIESCRAVGDAEFAYYSQFLKTYYLALGGLEVARALALFEELVERVRRGGLSYPEPAACERVYRLLGESPGPEDLVRGAAEDDAWNLEHGGWAQAYSRTLWMLVLCVHGQWSLAHAKAMSFDALVRSTPYVHLADHTFYRGLSAAVLASEARGSRRRRLLCSLREAVRRLERWARGGPDFVHMHTLLAAEQARLRRSSERAYQLYARAAKRAEDVEFAHHAALAYERLAGAYTNGRRHQQATVARAQAVALYRRWGAQAKARELERSGA